MRVKFPTSVATLMIIAATTGGSDAPAQKAQELCGKVVPLSSVLQKYGVKMDAESAAQWMALVTKEGKVYPLIKDESTRMFFKDASLLNRSMQLTARLLEGNFLHVLEVHSIKKDELYEIYYWCDVCSIRRMEKKTCECCGREMVLKEIPVEKK
jgi:hypothetical protein